MSHDCYCALCGGPLGSHSARLGSTKPKDLARRRRRIAKKQRRLAGEKNVHEDRRADGESTDEETPEEREKLFRYYEKKSYDPEVVGREDTLWWSRCRALGCNTHAIGIKKGFITQRGRGADYSSFEIVRGSTETRDINDPGDEYFTCYSSYDPDQSAVYPFHESCWELLSTFTCGQLGHGLLDKDALYSIMKTIHESSYGRSSSLGLDYGNIEGMEQFWDCVQGEEYVAFNPTLDHVFADHLGSELLPVLFGSSNLELNLDAAVIHDPFCRIPFELVLQICSELDVKSVCNLARASWNVFTYSRSEHFWKTMLSDHIMPWLSEASSLVSEVEERGLSHRKLCLWLDHVTNPKFGQRGPFMGLANRRRIWNACQGLISLCLARVQPKDVSRNEEAMQIMDSAVSLHMPMTIWPTPKGTTSITTQFIRSWRDFEATSKAFAASFDKDGALAGLSISIEDDLRTFGLHESHANEVKTSSLELPHADWIRTLLLHVQDFDISQEMEWNYSTTQLAMTPMLVTGVSIVLESGGSHTLGTIHKHSNCRALVTTPDSSIVGLTGEISAVRTLPLQRRSHADLRLQKGSITRLGLLQSPPSSDQSLNVPELFLPLWRSTGAASSHCEPLARINASEPWTARKLRLLNLHEYDSYRQIPLAMSPHELVLWAECPKDLRTLREIQVNQVFTGHISSGSQKREVMEIIGLRVKRAGIRGESDDWQVSGTGDSVPVEQPEYLSRYAAEGDLSLAISPDHDPWCSSTVVSFAIDGAGGEILTKVFVRSQGRAVKLVTNYGREVFFGENLAAEHRNTDSPLDPNWHAQEPAAGEVIVGFVMCFGTPSGYLNGPREPVRFSHRQLTSIQAIVADDDR